MKQFVSVHDVADIEYLLQQAAHFVMHPLSKPDAGKGKTVGLIFLNPSLRTRLSTQKAAQNLGMQVMVMNLDKEGWALELQDGAMMNGTTVEHIRDAAAVMGTYCDVIGIRCFAALQQRETDEAELLLTQLQRYAGVPVVSLESATLHPLQSLADLLTIRQYSTTQQPRIVLTWAPHVKPLPQAVANSFAQWVLRAGYPLTITHPEGLELDTRFTAGARITHNQDEALTDADFVYVKNWSSYTNYGSCVPGKPEWLLTPEKLLRTNNAYSMHCLPVRRNVELSDAVLDSPRSLIYRQAANRVAAAQAVLHELITHA